MFRVFLSSVLFILLTGPPVFAQTPKILELSEVQFGTKAVGFSVFRGVEPKRFDVELRGVTDAEGFNLILSHISGGPMETALEKIGAIAGMSGSPIFIGDCLELDECVSKAVLADNDVFLVGSLSYAAGYFIVGGTNVLLTPAGYMLGSRLGGYGVSSQFSVRPPNKVVVDGREFYNLMLFSGIGGVGSLPVQGSSAGDVCDESVKSDIKPGSMVTVFLARGSRDVGGSGTVTWRDGDKIYIFGHPFFGTGAVNYPFVQVSVADTLQTPYQAHKIVGCSLETEGVMLMDGAHEMAGLIGSTARMLPLQAELHVGGELVLFQEEIAESPMASAIINQLPIAWVQQLLGDTSFVSVSYQTRITVTDEPEIFLKSLVPAQVVRNPFAEVFTKVSAALEELNKSGFNYNLEKISTHIDLVKGISVWTAKRSFLSQRTAKPGDTVYVNVVLEEYSSRATKQISIPIEIPEDFNDRIKPPVSPSVVTVIVQSANKFVDKASLEPPASLGDMIRRLNESADRKTNLLYVQQLMPPTKASDEAVEKKTKSLVQPDWSWVELDQGALRRLPQNSDKEVLLTVTPLLGDFIDFDATFTISVNVSGKLEVSPDDSVKKGKRWFDYLKFWRIF